MYELTKEKEKVVLFAVDVDNGTDVYASLEELKELAKTADAECVGMLVQNRERVESGTYLGKGKIEELRELVEQTGADGVICDDELSPAQMKNLELALDCKVCDRTMLILDIFALHAKTGEGKLQVELAQLKYRATRLVGSRTELSRLGGGIGTRGPGEKKLETDRRLIKDRISALNGEIEELKRSREVARSKRSKNRIPQIAIVGYTNAGKSTLLNHLTDAQVLSENKLFATLDPTTRSYRGENGMELLFTDTVGFIRKLPHHLVDAFRSTLEEAKYADIILHVADASNPDCDIQMHTVYDTLKRLGIGDKPIVTAFNKCDLYDDNGEERPLLKDLTADSCVWISAAQGIGIEELIEEIVKIARSRNQECEVVVPYSDGATLNYYHKYGEISSEEYKEDGIHIRGFLPV